VGFNALMRERLPGVTIISIGHRCGSSTRAGLNDTAGARVFDVDRVGDLKHIAAACGTQQLTPPRH
jgi:hypothetical protein